MKKKKITSWGEGSMVGLTKKEKEKVIKNLGKEKAQEIDSILTQAINIFHKKK